MSTIRVFISYSHDSATHKASVLALAQNLREAGLDCQIDQFVNGGPSEGWPLWMERQIAAASFVLVVCSAAYLQRFEGTPTSGTGRGAKWEALLARQDLYDLGPQNTKFVPVLLAGAGPSDIPKPLRPYTYYPLPDAHPELLRYLTNNPAIVPVPLGGGQRAVAPRIQKLVAELAEHMEAGGSMKVSLMKARRIANLRGDQYHVKIFGMHLSGEVPLVKSPKPGVRRDPVEFRAELEVFMDRAVEPIVSPAEDWERFWQRAGDLKLATFGPDEMERLAISMRRHRSIEMIQDLAKLEKVINNIHKRLHDYVLATEAAGGL